MRTLFPEGHDVFASGLEFVEESRDYEDRQRTLAIVGDQYGVVSGLDVLDVSAVTPDIQVSAGLAIDALGNRVVLDADMSITGLTMADIGRYVVAYQDNLDIFPTAHPITGASAYTREVDGASVVVTGGYASGSGHVLLACISNVVTGGAPSVSLSTTLRGCREELRIDPQRLGTAMDVNKHRLSAHAYGISGGTGSLVPSIIDAATDYIAFTAMVTDNWLSVNGVLLSEREVNPIDQKYVYFSTVTDAAGAWNIYIDSSGNTGKTQAALAADQFLIATVVFDNGSGDLSSLVDSRVFYETSQELVRVDLAEAQTNDSLTAASTVKNNLNRIRYRLNTLETTAGGAYPVIGNANCDYNGATHTVWAQAIAALPASGGTLVLADGIWAFGATVTVDKPIRFVGEGMSIINLADAVTNAFLVQSDSVTFEGIEFVLGYASGGTAHVIDLVDQDNLTVRDCRFAPEVVAPAANLYGELVRIAGGVGHAIEHNRYETDTAQMYLVRLVQSAGNIVSGIRVADNQMFGQGCANLFHLDSGDSSSVAILHNQGIIGSAGGLRSWVVSDSGTTMGNSSIVGNTFECLNSAGASVPIALQLSHTGGGAIVGNCFKFTDPGTTFAVGIILADDFAVCGNRIRDAHIGIGLSDRCAVNGNNLYGITSVGISIGGDYNNVVGNFVQGTGSLAVDINGDYNLVDANTTLGMASGVNDDGSSNWAGVTDKTSNMVN